MPTRIGLAERLFIDTNLLIYADDDDAGERRDIARTKLEETIADERAVLSTQVLQEYFAVATRKLGLAPAKARQRVEILADLDVVIVRPELILGAIDLHRLHSLSFWDALILASASAAGCASVLTDDLASGAVIAGVRIENPFADAGA